MAATDSHRLVYYSRNLVPGSLADIATEIEAILAASQRNNSRVGVTGALIFNSGIFAQVLEGGLREIETTFERIQQDERHGEVQVLSFEAVESRGFPSWSMAFVGRSIEGKDLFSHIGDMSGYNAKRMEGDRIFRIMCDIALHEERRAA